MSLNCKAHRPTERKAQYTSLILADGKTRDAILFAIGSCVGRHRVARDPPNSSRFAQTRQDLELAGSYSKAWKRRGGPRPVVWEASYAIHILADAC